MMKSNGRGQKTGLLVGGLSGGLVDKRVNPNWSVGLCSRAEKGDRGRGNDAE